MKLYEIDDDYISYLQQFDNKVLNPTGRNYIKSRKYIGLLLKVNDCDYIAPLSSPNKNTDFEKNGAIKKSNTFIIRIIQLGKTKRLLGTIKLSNMIPVSDDSVIKYYDATEEKDKFYKRLIMEELKFMYANKEKINNILQNKKFDSLEN